MTIHITWQGVLQVIGAATVAAVVGAVLYGIWVLIRYGK